MTVPTPNGSSVEVPLSQREEEAATMQRLIQGVQEDMMVALLETVQSAAAVCTQICVQRLQSLHKEMVNAVGDEAEAAKRTPPKLASLGGKITKYTFDDESEEEAEEVTEAGGNTIEGIYGGDTDWQALPAPLAMTPPPVAKRRAKNRVSRFRIIIPRQHWNRTETRRMVHVLRDLNNRFPSLAIGPLASACEIIVRGPIDDIEAAKPDLAKIVMDNFPFAGLPPGLRVPGVREETRRDPADGKIYTAPAMWEKYRADFTQDEVWGYWEAQMEPAEATEEGAVTASSAPEQAAAIAQEGRQSARGDGPRPRNTNQAAARMLTRGLRDALTPPGVNASEGAGAGTVAPAAEVAEFRVVLDGEFWNQSFMTKLRPDLQKVGDKFDNLKIAPIMGRGEIFAKGDARSLELAKPYLAEALLKNCPFADLPPALQVPGVRKEERVDPDDGRSYTIKGLREKYKAKYEDEEIIAYWNSRMRAEREHRSSASGEGMQ